MPLIDDDTRVTDRKSRSVWPWVIVAAGFAFLWLLFALGVSFVPVALRGGSSSPPAPTAPMQAQQSNLLQQAQRMMGYGMPQQAVTLLAGINPQVPMSLSDKHTYLRVSAKSLKATGSPLAASRYYDRFLTLGISIHSAECQSCHGSTAQIPPRKLEDLLKSDLGKSYVAALAEAGKVKATRAALEAELKKNAKDARAHLLLYHIAIEREEPAVATRHADALKKLDDLAEAAAAKGN